MALVGVRKRAIAATPLPDERPRLLFLNGDTVVNNAGDRLLLRAQVDEP
jgi:hypothetical protein